MAEIGWPRQSRQAVGRSTLEAEDGRLGEAPAVTPATWTGESHFAGSGYAALGDGGTVTFDLLPPGRWSCRCSTWSPAAPRSPRSAPATSGCSGSVDSGAIGAQGDSPAPGALLPVTVPKALQPGASTRDRHHHHERRHRRLDAVMLEPPVSRLVLRGAGHSTALLSSASNRVERTNVRAAGTGPVEVATYDARGRLVESRTTTAATVSVAVPARGFALVTR